MKIYLDSAVPELIRKWKHKVDGFTTNPTILKQANIKDKYHRFIERIVDEIDGKPISFEVLADDKKDVSWQAHSIATMAPNVYVKVPIVNSLGFSNGDIIQKLCDAGLKVNITAVMAKVQIDRAASFLNPDVPAVISVFAGRIADTGRDPKEYIRHACEIAHDWSDKWEVLWASPRQVYNVYEAEECGADIITLTPELYGKYHALKDKDLEEFSMETSKMFFEDAQASGIEF